MVYNNKKSKKLSQETLVEKIINACKGIIVNKEKGTGSSKFEMLYILVRKLNLSLH